MPQSPDLPSPRRPSRSLSVGAKFGLIIVLCTAFVVAASLGAIMHRLDTAAAAKSEAAARATATRLSAAVQGVFEKAFDIVGSSQDTLAALKEEGVADPLVYDSILKNMVQLEPNRYGAWLVWDTGTDRADAGVYWHQNGMEMLRDAVPPEVIASDLYAVPRTQQLAYLLEPHAIDAVNGDPTLVTSYARPVVSNGAPVGVLALDLKLDAISEALERVSLPEGARIAVISDGGMVAMSSTRAERGHAVATVNPDLARLFARVRRTDGAEMLQAGGGTQLRAWTRIAFNGVQNPWMLIMQVPNPPLLGTTSEDTLFALLIGVAALAAMLCLVLLAMSRLVTRPLRALTDVIGGLGAGLFDLTVPGTKRTDEVGEIARAVERLQDGKVEIARLMEESGEVAYRRQIERRQELDEISHRFSARIEGLVTRLDAVAATVNDQSQDVSRHLADVGRHVASVSEVSQRSRDGMVSMATATTALMTAIGDIGTQREQAIGATDSVSRHTAATDVSIAELRDTIGQVDKVATLINKIAGQINLIALNATIEAARAGEAGRGFAVVAQEIKHLANQTAQATADIRYLIDAIHNASGEATVTVGEMRNAFQNLRDVTRHVADALDVQLHATGEISNLARTALAGVDSVAHDVNELVGSAGRIDGAAHVMLAESSVLQSGIAELKTEVAAFLSFLHAA